MPEHIEPEVGARFILPDDRSFVIIDVSEEEETVEVEYDDGETEKFDLESWYDLDADPLENEPGWDEAYDEDEEEQDSDWEEEGYEEE